MLKTLKTISLQLILNRNWKVMSLLLISLYFLYPGAEGSFTEEGADSPSTSSWSSGCCHSSVVFSAFHVMTHRFADEEVRDEEVGKLGSGVLGNMAQTSSSAQNPGRPGFKACSFTSQLSIEGRLFNLRFLSLWNSAHPKGWCEFEMK